jgi:hypothetical protein
MTLAVLLSLCMFCSGPATAGVRAWTQTEQDPSQAKPADSSKPAAQSATAPQTTAPAPANNPASSPSAAPKKVPAVAKRKPQSTAKNAVPCKAAANTKASPKGNQSGPTTTAGSGSAAADLPPCPPPKVVVRNGGTAEGTVQLTGGTVATKNSPQRANTERLLASSEDELKTTGGHQLDSAQQEMVKQIHQYQAQSKTALQAGDLELAHNLAVKAHLLADQLVKPQP